MTDPQIHKIQQAVLNCSEKISKDALSVEDHENILMEIERLYNEFRAIPVQYVKILK